MLKLICRIFGHGWTSTHYNRYGIPTREECCRCNAVREWSGGVGGGWKGER